MHKRLSRFGVLSFLIGAAVSSACSEHSVVSPELTLPTDFVISNAHSSTPSITATSGRGSISVVDQRIVYVSLPPHTLPDGSTVLIQTPGNGGILTAPLIHGGFDPVPVAANEGDEIKLTITETGGVKLTRNLKVPARRPPTIVRSDPRNGRTDIALNVSVTVVFTEPIDQTTINSNSVYLLKEGSRVAGHAEVVDNSWTVKFVPDKPLTAQSNYELVVGPSIRDLDGDALEGSYSATFVTGSIVDSPCPGYADPADCPPFPTGEKGTISGVVLERTVDGVRPLGNATVWAWFQSDDRSRYPGGGVPSTQSNADGKFTITGLPAATIILEGYAPGYDHPCANIVIFNGIAVTENIELVAKSHPLPDITTTRPLIKGMVYETTPDGKKPIPGASVYFDPLGVGDLVSAITTTDADGRYALCNVTSGPGWFGPGWIPWIVAFADGYVQNEQDASVSGDNELTVDIELKH